VPMSESSSVVRSMLANACFSIHFKVISPSSLFLKESLVDGVVSIPLSSACPLRC
jgi:hypothetical protein